MGRVQSDTYICLFNKSDNVNVDETFDRKSVFVHVLKNMGFLNIYCILKKEQLVNPLTIDNKKIVQTINYPS